MKTVAATAIVVLGTFSLGAGSRVEARTHAVLRLGLTCNDSPSKPVVRFAPSRCTILGPSASFAQGLNLTSLKWRTWGGSSAVGTGVELGFLLPYSHVPVAVPRKQA